MRSAPLYRAAGARALVPGSAIVIAVTVLSGCGGGAGPRLAATPAVRLDRPAPAQPPPAARSGFEEETVAEERLADADPATEGPARDTLPPEPSGRNNPPPASRKRDTEASHRKPDTADDEEPSTDDVPPLRHVLRRGQTLYSVAKMYGVEVPDLMKANGIRNARHIQANTLLVIPVTRQARGPSLAKPAGVTQASLAPGLGLPEAEDAPSGQKKKKSARDKDEAAAAQQPALAWPVQGAVTGAFGRRGKSDHHEGIDIDGQTGDPIHAAASGVVAFAGPHGDYGRTIVIDHGEGWRTIYAHASELHVNEGDPVRVGDTIAEVGHSGNARGSHLHFEVRRDGRALNPIPYLRSTETLTAGVVPTPKPKSKPRQAKGKSTSRP